MFKMNRLRYLLSLGALGCLLLGCPSPVRAEEYVKVKILAVNPSETNVMKASVTHMLPSEIQLSDVVDNAGMDLNFDKERNAYILTKEVELAPKETRTIIVKVKNVWVIPEDKLALTRQKLEKELLALQGTKYFDSAKLIYEKTIERLDQIDAERRLPIGIRQQIELYRAHIRQLAEIDTGIMSMESMRNMAMKGTGEIRTAKFNIKAENPADDTRTMVVRAELPPEVKSQDILEKLDFTMLYDEVKGRFVLEKQEEFGAKEVKEYRIILKDIWYIPQDELDYLRTQTQKILTYFTGSAYESYANEIAGYIYASLDEINVLQAEMANAASIDERMRAFVLNNQKLRLTRNKLRELQDLLLELPLEKKQDTLLQKMVRGIREIQKIKDVTKLLSMGIDPKISTTWWIIFGIMIFLGILALVFYVTWLGKLNQIVWERRQKLQASTKK